MIRNIVVKVTSERMKTFLDALRRKKQEDLSELDRKFLYFFGNESNL